jgi:hypothetical protein
MSGRVVRRRLDRRPRWNPEWTDAGRLVEDRGDVASTLEHCHAKSRVLQDRCAAAVESFQFDHGAYYLRPDRGLRRPGTVRRDASVTPLVYGRTTDFRVSQCFARWNCSGEGVRGTWPTEVRAAARAWTFRAATSRPRLSERNVLLCPEETCHHCRAGCIVPGRARFASSLRGPPAARDDAES